MRREKLAFFVVLLLFSCGKDKENRVNTPEKPERIVAVPAFNADSAYYFVKKQVDFGPRIPNTEAHRKTGDYLELMLTRYGATLISQKFEANSFDGKRLTLRNIIASYYPEKQKRILLAAHWDTRPFADRDTQGKDKPFDGANDGASGVGLLLEMARILNTASPPDVGVDLILFDGEDWGEREDSQHHVPHPSGLESWWCLGSQHWAKNKHKPNYSAYYGILFDMVGGKNAQFHREATSLEYAPKIVEKVWNTAERLGYSHVFVKRNIGGIHDDHEFVNKIGKIPTIDIISHDPASGWFGTFHHTHADNMDLISKETLKAVGETVLNVVYYEESGS